MLEGWQRIAGNLEFFLAHGVRPLTGYVPDVNALRAGPARIVAGIGEASGGQLAHRAAVALAERLDSPPVTFPGDHGAIVSRPGNSPRPCTRSSSATPPHQGPAAWCPECTARTALIANPGRPCGHRTDGLRDLLSAGHRPQVSERASRNRQTAGQVGRATMPGHEELHCSACLEQWPSQPATRYRPSPNTNCTDAPRGPRPIPHRVQDGRSRRAPCSTRNRPRTAGGDAF
jgi:hypothetical protein